MTNAEAIKKIESILDYKYHFTDYKFEETLGPNCKCRRPDKKDWLVKQFSLLMNRLKFFLENDPDKEVLNSFVLNELNQLDTSLFMKEEFKLLLLKYGDLLLFGLGLHTAHDYLKNKG